MGLPDNQLDAWIETALQTKGGTSPQQKQRAWERISQRVKHQSILPELEVPEHNTLWQRAMIYSSLAWQWVTTIAADEGQYERARQTRYMMRCVLPLHDSRMPTQMIEPLRLNFMSPVF